jgi:hypothetical protein
MLAGPSFWKTLPLIGWPGISRHALATLLPAPAQNHPSEARRPRALVLDPRFARALRALGYEGILADRRGNFGPLLDEPPQLLCATAPPSDLITAVRTYAGWVKDGGMVVLRCAAARRGRVGAACLHAGLFEVQQVQVGRSFLTAGVVRTSF